jgi:hypothetical protein
MSNNATSNLDLHQASTTHQRICILLGIILGISRILGINISELSKRDPNHKKP